MNTDRAYGKAMRYLDTAGMIWESGDQDRYCIAENCRSEAIKIMNQYFSETKVLTRIEDIDSLLP
jgi:hypothetical protein